MLQYRHTEMSTSFLAIEKLYDWYQSRIREKKHTSYLMKYPMAHVCTLLFTANFRLESSSFRKPFSPIVLPLP